MTAGGEITSVTFYRGEDPWAQAYSETMWLIRRPSGETIESFQIVNEWSSRRNLLRAFAQHIPGFDIREAKRGIRTRKRGYWMCFPSLEEALNAEARERASAANTSGSRDVLRRGRNVGELRSELFH
jgi:hypothetical protein